MANRWTKDDLKRVVAHIREAWRTEIEGQVEQDQEMRDWLMWDLEFDVFQRYSRYKLARSTFEEAVLELVFRDWVRVSPNPFATAYRLGQNATVSATSLETGGSVTDAIAMVEAIRRGSQIGAKKSATSRRNDANRIHAEVVSAAKKHGWPKKVPGLTSILARKFGRSDENIRVILKKNLQSKGADLD